ncbi:uncharacterized protein TEOVI_000206200 [Trypanosoma equiperdum]|uniref:Uncharacterized protein n=1 Tax=Trypanosoma equiperdum TaxID=5694 RepID=A0A1G4IDY2_TRYEQ|nr:hypothetical protein, conserved [Trypanosoma equiperdum]
MQILFGVLLLISCSTVWADDNTCYCTKETGEVYREESTNAVTKFILRGGDKFFDTEKTWMFCDASQHDTQFKLWSCNSRKTMKELVGNNAILRKEVEASNLCESTIASQKEEHVQNIGKLQTELRELQTERENIKRKVNKQEKEQEKIEQDIQKLNKLNEIITELQTRNSKKQKKLENEVQQCDNNITNHFIKPKEEILQKINVSLHDLKEQLNSMTQMFEEGIKKSNCSVCSANICYSTPSVKAELDKKYLENSWLNLTAAQREQCPLDDTMLLPMLSYMRRKPFDGAYAHNQYVNMMEKLFALVISFFCFFI